MDPQKNTLERAFELARSGKYGTVGEVKKALAAEGYSPTAIVGPSLVQQLSRIVRDSRLKG